MTPAIADVYKPGLNVMLPTTPGRTVRFSGGHAVVFEPVDVPFVLRLEGATVEFHPSPYEGMIQEWVDSCGDRTPCLARIVLPEPVVVDEERPLTPIEKARAARAAKKAAAAAIPQTEPEPAPSFVFDSSSGWEPPKED